MRRQRRNRNSLLLKYTPNLPKISSVNFVTPSLAALVLNDGYFFQKRKGSLNLAKVIISTLAKNLTVLNEL